MHYDARALEDKSLIEGDVCIVGAGAAGISMALDWLNTPHKVILLEGGGFELETAMQDLFYGKSTGLRYYSLSSTRLHYFGGTTRLWGGFCSVLDPIDFKKREWVPNSGWPITREDLDPYYKKAHPILELGPYNYDLNYWRKIDPLLSAIELDDQVVYNKVWQFSPPTRFGKKYKDILINATNIHLYTHANLTRIETNEHASHVTEVTVRNLQGREHTVRARYFVLACCSIQNARLLLASNHIALHGLGNTYDLVGRYFMEHVEINSGKLRLLDHINSRLYLWEIFQEKVRAELAMSHQKQEELQVLNGTVSFSTYTPYNPPANIDTYPASAEENVQIAEFIERKLLGKRRDQKITLCNSFNLFTRMEQAPNPDSRVVLDREKDALGVPHVILHWKLSDLEKRSIRKLYEMVGQQIGLAGLGRIHLDEWLHDETDDDWPSTLGGGWHHMGTTRMHEDRRKGVVDAHCKVHGIGNLYMAGSSCFPTGGAVNPTLTLIALTLRLSDHLKQRMSHGGS